MADEKYYIVKESSLTSVADKLREASGSEEKISFPNGYIDSVDDVVAKEQAVLDSIVDGSISGAYTNGRVTRVKTYAFYKCTDLTSADFPAATSIKSTAFQSCTGLISVDFPNITNIEGYVFQNCKKLTALILRADQVCTLFATNAFTGTPIESGTGYIYVPDDLVEDYKAATNWSTYADQIKPISELPEEEEDKE